MVPILAALLIASGAPAERPRTYLASLVNLPLKAGERISAFRFDTWGVRFEAICRFPPGWRLKAGGDASPGGEFEGEGSVGASWLYGSDRGLREFLLVTLSGPVRKSSVEGSGVSLPATFTGNVRVETFGDEEGRTRVVSWRNLRLTPARRCSAP